MTENKEEKLSLDEMDEMAGGIGSTGNDTRYAEYKCTYCGTVTRIPSMGFFGIAQCSKCKSRLVPANLPF